MASAEKNRLFALWATAETRSRVWGGVAAVAAIIAIGNTILTVRVLDRPREVVRVACDGIPQLVTLTAAYDEPQDAEIRAFAAQWAIAYSRMDSFSLRNDFLYCAQHMVPALRSEWRKASRDLVGQLEPLQRRTYIDPSRVTVELPDKATYPLPVRVRGVRQVLAETGGVAEEQPFDLRLTLVKTARSEVISGLLVYSIHTDGTSIRPSH